MDKTIELAREAGGRAQQNKNCDVEYVMSADALKALEALVRADERMSFYGQDKPAECADGCPPNQICDYCQVVAPAKAMILAEREACAKVCETYNKRQCYNDEDMAVANECAAAIRNRGNT
jgi:hypothetical protein